MEAGYRIPEKILNDIPPYFYAAFAGELCSVFGPRIFEKSEGDVYALAYIEGTAGWVAVFRSVTNRLGMSWLSSYYDGLNWFDYQLRGPKPPPLGGNTFSSNF